MVRILVENPVSKCHGKSILLVCVHYPHAGECTTALHVIFFLGAEMLFCRMIRYWYIYSCGGYNASETSPEFSVEMFGHLRMQTWIGYCLHTRYTTRIICILSTSQAFWRIWTYAFHLTYLLVTKRLRLKMANLSELVGFALTVATRWKKESRLKSSFPTAPEIWIASKSNSRFLNRTPDKLNRWRFFSWHSTEDLCKIRVLTAK